MRRQVDLRKPLTAFLVVVLCATLLQLSVTQGRAAAAAVEFTSVSPSRVFDTRPGQGGIRTVSKAKVGGGYQLRVKVTDLPGVVPATGVGAVSMNVTVTEPDGAGYVTVYPCEAQPNASSLNYVAGQTIPNAVIAPVSAQGEVCFYSQSPTHILADVNGWFASGSSFTSVSPSRVFDTRPGQGGIRSVSKAKVGGGYQLRVKVTDLPGVVPATGVGAVSMNVTVTEPDGAGFVTVYPCGAQPNASSLNYVAGQTIPNAVIAPVSAQGEVCFYSQSPTHILADVNGWFASGSSFTSVSPSRVFDTRPGQGGIRTVSKAKVGGGYQLRVKVTDLPGVVPASGVGAVSMNVTVTEPDGAGYVTVYPCGTQPNASSLNYVAGQTIPNAVIAPVSDQGEVCFYSQSPTHILADINGWFSSSILQPTVTLHPGGLVRVTGSGFKSGSAVRLELHSDPVVLNQVFSANDGSVDEIVQIPGDAPPGDHDIVLVGVNSSNAPKTITIPIDLIVPTADQVTQLSGRIVNSNGQGVRDVVITSSRIDGSALAQGQTNGDGSFAFDVPTGINQVTFAWGGWVDAAWQQQLQLPSEWSLDVKSVDFAGPVRWEIELPPTIELTVQLPGNVAGFVGLDPVFPDRSNVGTDPISTEVNITDSVKGAVRMGYAGSYAEAGTGAVLDVFPVDSVTRIFEMVGGGDNAGVGLNNVDVSSPRTVQLVESEAPVQVWFLLADSNSEITSIIATKTSDQAQLSSSGPTIWIEGGTNFDIEVSGTTDNTEWTESFTNQSFLHEFNHTLLIPSRRNPTTFAVSMTPPSSSYDLSTLEIETLVELRPDAYLSEESIDPAVTNLLPGFTCARGVPIRCTASTSGTTATVPVADIGDKFERITVTGRVTLLNGLKISDTATFRSDDFQPGTTVNVTLAPTVDPSFSPSSGTISGQVANANGGVGITRLVYRLGSGVLSPLNGFSSNADGTFALPVAINPDVVVIQGEMNIDPARGVPPLWSLVVPSNRFNLGVFTLPDVQRVSVQVLSPFGFPIPGARITEEATDGVNLSITSSTGVVGHLYNGLCPAYFTYPCMWTGAQSSVVTDQYGIAQLSRFNLQRLGRLHLSIPASGPNSAMNLTVDSATLSGGSATLVIPDRL